MRAYSDLTCLFFKEALLVLSVLETSYTHEIQSRFESRKLKDVEQRYSTHEKEMTR